MLPRDPYVDHVLAIAGLDPATFSASAGADIDPQVQAANLRAQAIARQYVPAPAPAPAYPLAPYAPPGYPAAAMRPPVCYDWTTVAIAGAIGGLFGFLLGSGSRR